MKEKKTVATRPSINNDLIIILVLVRVAVFIELLAISPIFAIDLVLRFQFFKLAIINTWEAITLVVNNSLINNGSNSVVIVQVEIVFRTLSYAVLVHRITSNRTNR